MDAAVIGRIITPFDVCAEPEVFVAVRVSSAVTETAGRSETQDDDVEQQLVTATKFSPFRLSFADSSSSALPFDFPSLGSSVVRTAPSFNTAFRVPSNA